MNKYEYVVYDSAYGFMGRFSTHADAKYFIKDNDAIGSWMIFKEEV